MISEAIEKILLLAKVQELEINGRKFTDKCMFAVPDALPKQLVIEMLGSLCDYIKNDPDGYNAGPPQSHLVLIVHVASFNQVDLYAELTRNTLSRPHLLRVSLNSSKPFRFGQWLSPEEFIIGLQSQFVQTETALALQKVGSGLKSERAGTIKDDGVAQEVTLQEGTRLTEATIPNPVTLVPYRTFMEIDQPPSDFVFRLRSDRNMPECALFEGDGGAWKILAVDSIAKFIKKNIPLTNETIILS